MIVVCSGIGAFSACVALLWPNAMGQVGVIVCAAVVGLMLFKTAQGQAAESLLISIRRKMGVISLVVFFSLLAGLPLLMQVLPS